MQFYDFMMKKHLGQDTPVGDLAYDMQYERERFPRNDESDHRAGRLTIKRYLEAHNACSACLDSFKQAWKSYVRFERRQNRCDD